MLLLASTFSIFGFSNTCYSCVVLGYHKLVERTDSICTLTLHFTLLWYAQHNSRLVFVSRDRDRCQSQSLAVWVVIKNLSSSSVIKKYWNVKHIKREIMLTEFEWCEGYKSTRFKMIKRLKNGRPCIVRLFFSTWCCWEPLLPYQFFHHFPYSAFVFSLPCPLPSRPVCRYQVLHHRLPV